MSGLINRVISSFYSRCKGSGRGILLCFLCISGVKRNCPFIFDLSTNVLFPYDVPADGLLMGASLCWNICILCDTAVGCTIVDCHLERALACLRPASRSPFPLEGKIGLTKLADDRLSDWILRGRSPGVISALDRHISSL